jgi:hypothetical protein
MAQRAAMVANEAFRSLGVLVLLALLPRCP